MTRSRAVLLFAWALLAVASVVQFLRGGDELDRAGTGNDAAAAELPTAETGQMGVAATVDRLAHRWGGPSEADGGDGRSAGGVTADDPAGWDRAGPVLSPTSVVATVTSDGVASLTAPEPGDHVHWFPNPTQFGSPRTFLVIDDTSSADYIKVSLPVMPNGQEGWIPRSEVELSTVEHRAVVDVSDRSVTVWRGDEVVATTGAVTGKEDTPTPTGLFYVRDIIAQPDPGGGYGPWILALSGFSEVLDTFNGGLPALALHGTDKPEQIGSARSSGCVRVPNEVISLLAETVPLGTPVAVVA
jgi:hypothetical protein